MVLQWFSKPAFLRKYSVFSFQKNPAFFFLSYFFFCKSMSFLSQLNWRYATKKFDTTKKVSDENLAKLIEAIRMTPTAFGIQPYHFYVISNDGVKQALSEASFGQLQPVTSSHVIIMCARQDFVALKDEYFSDLLAKLPESEHEKIKAYKTLIEEKRLQFFTVEWAKRQVYIAQGFALAACAELEIDSCPME